MSAPAARARLSVRLWNSYLSALQVRPIRTRVITSSILFFTGDLIAQLVIEDRRLVEPDQRSTRGWDPARTARMTAYGVVFAPLGHMWLSTMQRIQLSSTLKTTSVRMLFDSFLWSPFVCCLFPTCMGIMEGKTPSQIKTKVQELAPPTWKRAICVFGPTQIVNYSFVPAHLRLLLLQSVGFCWNIYLSWANERNNTGLSQSPVHSPID